MQQHQARLAPLTLMAGLATGVLTVAVHDIGWAMLLAVATALLMLFAAPPGWGTRLPFGIGFVLAVGVLAVPRPEGDYLLSNDVAGYLLIGVAVLVLTLSIATLPRRTGGGPGESPAET